MPRVRHGRFTVNADESLLMRDNSARYEHVALDEWDGEGNLLRTISLPMVEPLHSKDLLHIVAALNAGTVRARFAN